MRQSGNALQQYRSYNYNLLAIAAFTLLNVLLVIFKSDSYFLFSAYLPYYLVLFGAVETGHLPVEGYVPSPALPTGAFVATVVFALIIVAVYVALWYFSRKSYIPLIVGIVLMGIDTVAMFTLIGFDVSMLIDYLLHGAALFLLIRGAILGKQLSDQGFDLNNAYAAPDPSDYPPDPNDNFYTASTSGPTAGTPADATADTATGTTDASAAEASAADAAGDAADTAPEISVVGDASADTAATDDHTDHTAD